MFSEPNFLRTVFILGENNNNGTRRSACVSQWSQAQKSLSPKNPPDDFLSSSLVALSTRKNFESWLKRPLSLSVSVDACLSLSASIYLFSPTPSPSPSLVSSRCRSLPTSSSLPLPLSNLYRFETNIYTCVFVCHYLSIQ